MQKKKSPSPYKDLFGIGMKFALIGSLIFALMYFHFDLIRLFSLPLHQGNFWEQVIYWIREAIASKLVLLLPVNMYYLGKLKSEVTHKQKLTSVLDSVNGVITSFWIINLIVLLVASFSVYFPTSPIVSTAFLTIIGWGMALSGLFIGTFVLSALSYMVAFYQNSRRNNLRNLEQVGERLVEDGNPDEDADDVVDELGEENLKKLAR